MGTGHISDTRYPRGATGCHAGQHQRWCYFWWKTCISQHLNRKQHIQIRITHGGGGICKGSTMFQGKRERKILDQTSGEKNVALCLIMRRTWRILIKVSDNIMRIIICFVFDPLDAFTRVENNSSSSLLNRRFPRGTMAMKIPKSTMDCVAISPYFCLSSILPR